MKDYIAAALTTESPVDSPMINRLARQTRAMHALLGLQTELGELVDGFKRHIFYGTQLDPTNLDEEVGDLLWYLAILLDEHGISFERCMERNIAKLKARYPQKFNSESAVVRDLEAERKALESGK